MNEPSADPPDFYMLVRRKNLGLRRRRGLAEPPTLPSKPDPPPAAPPKPKPDTPAAPPVLSRPRRALPVWRPQTRADCLPGGRNAQRPCPYASCRHNLLVDIDCETAKVRETAEDPASLPFTCSLDVADLVDQENRTVILRELQPAFGVTRERVRQLELRAIDAFQRGMSRKKTDERAPKVLASPWGSAMREPPRTGSEED